MREWQIRTDMMCNWYERMADQNRHEVPGMREWQIRTDMMCNWYERMADQNRHDV